MEGQDENSSAINISDVIEVIETDPVFGLMDSSWNAKGLGGFPFVKIIEQPSPRSLRENVISGANSTMENTTYPSIQIVGFKGRAVVLVSCVTKSEPYRPHPHGLKGMEGCRKGFCTIEINNENMVAVFNSLAIECVEPSEVEEALSARETLKIDAFKTGFGHKTQVNSIDLNSVRLCFQAFLEGPQPGKFTTQLQPAVTEPIYDIEIAPYLQFIEEPMSKVQFEREGRPAGFIKGANSTLENETFPTVQIVGYKGRAVVIVSCITTEPPYKSHPHNVIGKEERRKKGYCSLEINNDNMIGVFENIGVQYSDNVEEALAIREEVNLDPFRNGFSHRKKLKSINLNSVRLCFQAYLEGPIGKFNTPIQPIASEPIYDQIEGNLGTPYLKIVEQPASKALRFRYECEGRSAGSIPGVSSTPENKTFPSVQVVGYKGRAIVVVSCVTKDPPYKPHPHNLVGKEGCKNGVCTAEINNENMIVAFANLGIQCVKKKDIEEALKVRERIRVDPFRTGFIHKTQASSIDLNSVRLSFQAFLEGPQRGKFTRTLPPVVSEPIYDKKAMADLVICKLSHCSASVAGGNEIILLCEKVAKEDISVRFFEEKDGHVVWEGFGDFTPTQVHKQVAISFRTPRYKTLEIDNPVQALIQLRRPSDNATSEALPFQITPLDSDPAMLKRKRQKFDSDIIDQSRLHILEQIPAVKCEPDLSSNSYMLYAGGSVRTKVSPLYASRTPSPLDYTGGGIMYQSNFPGPSNIYQPYLGAPAAIEQQPQELPRNPAPATELLDMDTQQYSVELNFGRLDSDLAVLDGNLSANLSANLSLNDDTNKRSDVNMTDSLTRLANSTINELCGLDMYQGNNQ